MVGGATVEHRGAFPISTMRRGHDIYVNINMYNCTLIQITDKSLSVNIGPGRVKTCLDWPSEGSSKHMQQICFSIMKSFGMVINFIRDKWIIDFIGKTCLFRVKWEHCLIHITAIKQGGCCTVSELELREFPPFCGMAWVLGKEGAFIELGKQIAVIGPKQQEVLVIRRLGEFRAGDAGLFCLAIPFINATLSQWLRESHWINEPT